MTRGLLRHLLLTFSLNFRSKQAIIYGFVVPVLFLLAFASVFRSGNPPLLAQMGQIATITILGGACFGLPTGLVAERERGVWRRYRLLPVPTSALVGSTLVVRLVIVALAVLLQLVLARVIYGTPWPLHPLQLILGYALVCGAFMGLGLVIAALAEDVPAVQALGQCVFLPMIMIGGVGVPMVALPAWAQTLASFMPGRYAVEVLQPCFDNPHGMRDAGFSVVALIVIGSAATVVGARLFRWDNTRKLAPRERVWVTGALLGWVLVGLAATFLGRLGAVGRTGEENFDHISEAQIDGITYEMLPPDDGIYTPMAPPNFNAPMPPRLREFVPRLTVWPPGNRTDIGQSVRNIISTAAVADITQDLGERQIARAVFDYLRAKYPRPELERALAWVILYPQDGSVVTKAPELGLRGAAAADIVRERDEWYARKFLGRLLGKITDEPTG